LDLTFKSSASKVASNIGLDLHIKSDGNYIAAPPINHKSGNKYQRFGVYTPIEDAPDWLIYEIRLAMKPKESKLTSIPSSKMQPFNGEKNFVEKRNDYIFLKICRLINGFPKEEVIRRALQINDELIIEPLKEKEIITNKLCKF